MNNRLNTCFSHLSQRAALIPFITAGDPHPELTVPIMHTLVKAGADVIELGIPFSDPMADGPVIQRASERALANGVSLRDVLAMVAIFRQQDQTTPVVLMGYLNPIEIMGYETFAQAAQETGVDGVLTVDLPPEEAIDMVKTLKQHQLDPIFLLAPTSTVERIQQIANLASGYLYYVSLKGVTGSATLDTDAVAQKVAIIRQYTQLPIGVGFGIKDATTAAQVAKISNAVIVGSALVQRIETTARNALLTTLTEFMQSLRSALN